MQAENLDGERTADAALVKRSLVDPRAFGPLFDRHFDAVHAYVQSRVGVDLADEIAAETFTRAFDRRAGYDLRCADSRPWLLGIASNLVRRHWRTERRRLDAYARAVGSADVDTQHAEAAGEVLRALSALPPRQREVLLLFAWGDLTYDEIAQALEIPVGTVRSRLAVARRRLRSSGYPPNSSVAKEAHDV